MSAVLTIAQTQSSAQAIGRSMLSALCEVWTAHTLKRAIADVASMSEEDYRDFGLDKGEMLAALRSLRDEIKGRGTIAGSPSCRRGCNGCPLVIEVEKREPGFLVCALG